MRVLFLLAKNFEMGLHTPKFYILIRHTNILDPLRTWVCDDAHKNLVTSVMCDSCHYQ